MDSTTFRGSGHLHDLGLKSAHTPRLGGKSATIYAEKKGTRYKDLVWANTHTYTCVNVRIHKMSMCACENVRARENMHAVPKDHTPPTEYSTRKTTAVDQLSQAWHPCITLQSTLAICCERAGLWGNAHKHVGLSFQHWCQLEGNIAHVRPWCA